MINKVRCLVPFTLVQFGTYGIVRTCCEGWNRIGPIGNLNFTKDFKQIWNSGAIKMLRQAAIEDKLELTCNKERCPYLLSGNYIDLDQIIPENRNHAQIIKQIKEGIVDLNTGPLYANMGESGRCNLSCRMCMANSGVTVTSKRLSKRVYQDFLPNLLPSLSRIVLAGNGEVFFRKDTMKLLKDSSLSKQYPDLRVEIISNGVLFNENLWESIKHNSFSEISISIDAANEDTYRKLRTGGNWKKLMDGLGLISDLRQKGYFENLVITFLVLKSNFTQMKDFILLGEKLKCDQVRFQRPLGYMDVKENYVVTKNLAVMSEIAKMLDNPIFERSYVNYDLLKPFKKYSGIRITKFHIVRTWVLSLVLDYPMKLQYRIRRFFYPLFPAMSETISWFKRGKVRFFK